MRRRRWTFGSFIWTIVALVAAAPVALFGLLRAVEYMDRATANHVPSNLLALGAAATPLLIIALLLFGYHRATRWFTAAVAILWAMINVGGISVDGLDNTPNAALRWLLVALIAIVTLHRMRQARGDPAAPADTAITGTPPAPGTGTGLLIVGSEAAVSAVPHYVRDWAARHPEDASLAVAQIGDGGTVDATLYATTDGQPLWSGTIGRVSESRVATEAAPEIAKLLADALSLPLMTPEVAG